MKIRTFVGLLFTGISNIALASETVPTYEGCYEAESGYVETLATTLFTETPPNGLLRQQGTFSVEFEKSSKLLPSGVSKTLKIEYGTVVGEFTGSFTATQPSSPILLHTLTNDDRSGVIVSDTGFLVSTIPESACTIKVVEILEDFSGFGIYEGLDYYDSFIVVEGELNVCNGQNTFEVTDGQLCFLPPSQ
jgi:hypothetical protein